MADKVTFTEAAKALGIHINTIKNWQKSGRLPSAVKVKPPIGSAVWMVNLEEAAALVRHDDRSYVDTQPVRDYRSSTNGTESHTTDSQQDNQQSNTGAAPATAYLMALQAERDNLMRQIANLQEERSDYRQTLGELQGRVTGLEKEISNLRGERGGLYKALAAAIIVALLLALLLALTILLLKP